MKKIYCFSLIIVGIFGLIQFTAAATLAEKLSGRILLQVESKGEAWYINPANNQRYYLGKQEDAFRIMRELGLGIKHAELQKYLDLKFPKRLSGKIMLDVESRGEAYYVNPVDMKGYFLGKAADAYQIMRKLGLGISNKNLYQISVNQNYINKEEVVSVKDREYITAGVGEEVTFATVKLKIPSIKEEYFISGSGGTKVSNINKSFLVMDLEIQNITKQQIDFDPNGFILIGTHIDEGFLVYKDAKNYIDNTFQGGKIEPGVKKTGVLVFEVQPFNETNYWLFLDVLGTNKTYSFLITKSDALCGRYPKWSKNDCEKVAHNEVWIGMELDMLKEERGFNYLENVSNYGNGDQKQWCWWDSKTPSCFYDKNDDNLIDSYN